MAPKHHVREHNFSIRGPRIWYMMESQLFLFVLLCCLHCSYQYGDYDPKPNSKSVIQMGKARFTVLTENMIRMEWGGINDAPTFAFINRNFPTPKFDTSKDGNWTVIQTPSVKVRYLGDSDESFSATNLDVSMEVVNGKTVEWKPVPASQMALNGNLMGTIRTLDRVNGSIELDCYNQSRADLHCTLGLISKTGYVVIDDTNQPQFDDSSWPWVVNQSFDDCSPVDTGKRQMCGYVGISQFDCNGMGCCYDKHASDPKQACYYGEKSYRDLYFFGHGHDYKLALKEFGMVSGKIPIPPRYAFGSFYSRYWAYNDIGEMKLARDYEQRGIPLDVIVIDMDWHITFYGSEKDQAGERKGWTGFTWDSHLFPNPKKFLDWCKSKGLRNTLNLHPASGIQPWEDKYNEMATAMGIDPSTNHYVPFVPSDKKFVTNWFKIVLGAREEEGIDFWWLDWQQGEDWIKVPGVNPTFWLNHIFFTDPYHWKNNTIRPLLLHRWGGLGNHRYQVGFSGDVYPSWASLDFQVTFTVTSSNVGFGYWSHDIGGHLAPCLPELYTRWVQWGAFSPIFRIHSSKNAANDRRIWVYPPENYEALRSAIRLRASLLPYIYSNARTAYDEGLSLLRPMYYEYPESPQAYNSTTQYYFGSDMIVAPITEPMDNVTGLASKTVWLPEGTYVSWFSGERVTGGKWIEGSYTLSEIPIFVKAGSIIPMRTDDFVSLGSAHEIPTSLKFVVFIGDKLVGNTLDLYEDDGQTTEYMSDKFVRTSVMYNLDMSAASLTLTIKAVKTGSYDGQPSSRSYQFCVPNFWPVDSVAVKNGDKSVPMSLSYVPLYDSKVGNSTWSYDGSTLSLIINVAEQPVSEDLVIVAKFSSMKIFDPYWFPGFPGKVARLQQMKELLDDQWGTDTVHQTDYPSFLFVVEAGEMITYDPKSMPNVVEGFQRTLLNGLAEVWSLQKLDADIKRRVTKTLEIEDKNHSVHVAT